MCQALAALVRHPHFDVAVISGRAVLDLRTRLPVAIPYLAGNHGLEIIGPGFIYNHPAGQQARAQLAVLADILRQGLAAFPGVWVEDKGLTLTIHWRQTPAAFIPMVHRRVHTLLGPDLEARHVVLRTGKCILEVRPPVAWHKGNAAHYIVDHMRSQRAGDPGLLLYIGDDNTDEDAFRTIHTTGLGIVVGQERPWSAAQYMLASVEHTALFLALCASIR